MRQFLNNPRVVLPLAALTLLFVSYRYELLDDLIPDIYGKDTTRQPKLSAPSEAKLDLSEARHYLTAMHRERWLPRNWERFHNVTNEPFVAQYSFEKAPLAVSAPEDEPVVIDVDSLDSYIADHLGLDTDGFLVRFGSIYKRPGDLLRTSEGRTFRLGEIALAEQTRSAVEHRLAIEAVVSNLQLYGTSQNAPGEAVAATEAAVDANGVDAESTAAEPLPIDSRDERAGLAFIEGGMAPSGIYKHGDLIHTNPALGLAAVGTDTVELVDRYGETYQIQFKTISE